MVCPYVEQSDVRCASHFNLGRLDQAFDHCFEHAGFCPVYNRLLREARRLDAAPELRKDAELEAALV
jgi:hypothetical protein